MAKKGKKHRDAARLAQERAAAAGLPALASTPKRSASGRAARIVSDGYERDAAVPTLRVRAMKMGWIGAGSTAADVSLAIGRARSQMLEGEAGRAIFFGCSDDDEGRWEMICLWETWSGFSAARLGYHRRILGISTGGSSLPVARSTEAAAEYQPDLRTQDERDADTINAWDFWRRQLRHISPGSADVLRDALTAQDQELVQCNTLSARGRAFVGALRELSALTQPSRA